jgi:hypothetical protein
MSLFIHICKLNRKQKTENKKPKTKSRKNINIKKNEIEKYYYIISVKHLYVNYDITI